MPQAAKNLWLGDVNSGASNVRGGAAGAPGTNRHINLSFLTLFYSCFFEL